MAINTYFKAAGLLVALSLCGCAATSGSKAPASDALGGGGISPGQARAELEAGNARYLNGGMEAHAWQQSSVIRTGTYGQSPSVGVLACADSRIPVEIIFDQGVGDLFVVRVAGNVDTKEGNGTFEYGLKALGVHTIVVLGHTKCGAVEATITGKALPSNMSSLSAAIQPALKGALQSPTDTASFELIRACGEANVRYQMKKLRTDSTLLAEAEMKGELTIMGAMYDVDTGRVQFLD
jgi:carbonic anhydrase